MATKPSVFISYRKSDSSSIAGRMYDRLRQVLGKAKVFKDSYNIPVGSDFRGVIRENVSQCDVVLVIIGPTWLTVTEGNPPTRRLDNPSDWVRFEIETGLQTPDTRVIPVLVGNASMPPPDQLPPTLRELAFRQSISVGDDPDFDTDMMRLIQDLRGRTIPAGLLTLGVIVMLLAIIGLVILANRGLENTPAAALFTESPTLRDTPLTPTTVPPVTATPPNTTATQVIDFGLTATEAILQLSVDAQEAADAALLGENTQIAASATETIEPTTAIFQSETSIPTPNYSFTYGGSAIVVISDATYLNVRNGFGLSYDVILQLPRSSIVTILAGPQNADNQSWWKIQTSDGREGWAVQGDPGLQALPTTDSDKFVYGGAAIVVIRPSTYLNVRNGYGLSYDVILKLLSGSIVTILAGPQDANNRSWWKIRAADGTEGWVAETISENQRTLAVLSAITVGDQAIVSTRAVNIRSQPGITSPDIGDLSVGTIVTVLDGPRFADGLTWWEIQTDDGIEGWVVEVSSGNETMLRSFH